MAFSVTLRHTNIQYHKVNIVTGGSVCINLTPHHILYLDNKPSMMFPPIHKRFVRDNKLCSSSVVGQEDSICGRHTEISCRPTHKIRLERNRVPKM